MTDIKKPMTWPTFGLAGPKTWRRMCQAEEPFRVVNGGDHDTIGYYVPMAWVTSSREMAVAVGSRMLSLSMEATRYQLEAGPLSTLVFHGKGQEAVALGYFLTEAAMKRARRFFKRPG